MNFGEKSNLFEMALFMYGVEIETTVTLLESFLDHAAFWIKSRSPLLILTIFWSKMLHDAISDGNPSEGVLVEKPKYC